MRQTLSRPPTPKFEGFRDYFLLEDIKTDTLKVPQYWGNPSMPNWISTDISEQGGLQDALRYEINLPAVSWSRADFANGFCSGAFFMGHRLSVEAMARHQLSLTIGVILIRNQLVAECLYENAISLESFQ